MSRKGHFSKTARSGAPPSFFRVEEIQDQSGIQRRCGPPAMKLFLSIALALGWCAAAAQIPPAVTTDPPENQANPATMTELAIPSHGGTIIGVVYIGEGAGPHPTVVLLHGFPGYEQSLDLAESMRRAGWNVIF